MLHANDRFPPYVPNFTSNKYSCSNNFQEPKGHQLEGIEHTNFQFRKLTVVTKFDFTT